jgi:hypothetical protein
MSIATFETEYGKIEINWEKKEVYFFQDDFGTNINNDGTFTDMWQRQYEVTWPNRWSTSPYAILRVIRPCLLGFQVPQPETVAP